MLPTEARQVVGGTLHAAGVEAIREVRGTLADGLGDVDEVAGLVGSAVGQRVLVGREVAQAAGGLCGPVVGLGAEVGECSLRRTRQLGSGVLDDAGGLRWRLVGDAGGHRLDAAVVAGTRWIATVGEGVG